MSDTKSIHKYTVPHSPAKGIPLHAGAVFLTFQMQDEEFTTWWLDDVNDKPSPVKLHIFGTGARVDNTLGHLGTVQEGTYVWHLFREYA